MMSLPGLSGAAGERPSMLPALFGVLLAIVFWMLADVARERLQGMEIQVAAAGRTANRVDDTVEADRLQQSLALAQGERAALTARLQTAEGAQMVRAKLVYDLRQKCASTGASVCNVRLADDTIAATASTTSPTSTRPSSGAGAAPDDKAKLIDLGIQKARAIISGSFQNDELAQLAALLHADSNAYWRINGVVVRGTTFEFDVERHMIPLSRGGS